jgi:DNA-binding beta-propeller fold protein YncE
MFAEQRSIRGLCVTVSVAVVTFAVVAMFASALVVPARPTTSGGSGLSTALIPGDFVTLQCPGGFITLNSGSGPTRVCTSTTTPVINYPFAGSGVSSYTMGGQSNGGQPPYEWYTSGDACLGAYPACGHVSTSATVTVWGQCPSGERCGGSIVMEIAPFTVTFTEQGLPSGTQWSVTLAGSQQYSTSPSIQFSKGDDDYAYTVGTVVGWLPSPSSGNVNVDQSNVQVTIVFTQIGSASGGSVSLGSLEPSDVAYDSSLGELFVTLNNPLEIGVVSDSNNTLVSTIPVSIGSDLWGIVYDSAHNELFVADQASPGTTQGWVLAVSISSGTYQSIPVLGEPRYLAYDSGKGEIFVTFDNQADIGVISDSTNTVTQNIAINSCPASGGPPCYQYQIVYDSGKGLIFASDLIDTVTVISDSTGAVTAQIAIPCSYCQNGPPSPYGMAYDSAKGEIFVVNAVDDSVGVISDSSLTVVTTISLGLSGSPFLTHAVYAPAGYVFVTNDDTSSTVAVVSDSTNAVVNVVNAGQYAWGEAYDSGNQQVYVVDQTTGGSGQLSVLTA